MDLTHLTSSDLLGIAVLLLLVVWLAVFTAGMALRKIEQMELAERQREVHFEIPGSATERDIDAMMADLRSEIAVRRRQILQAPRRPRGTAIPPQEA